MPEQSPDPGLRSVGSLVHDEMGHELEPDASELQLGAVISGPETDHIRRKGIGAVGWICVAWILVVLVVAVAGKHIPGVPDAKNDVGDPRLGWGAPGHVFGTDGQGRDVFALIVYGASASMFIGIVSVVMGFFVGGTLGLVAGYFKGRIGGVLGGVTDILLAYPQLVLALSIVTFLDNSVFWVTVALAIVSTPVLARIARAATLSWSEREFVVAARAQGAKHARVMIREILPNIVPAMLSIALLGVAVVIVAEAGLAIIGAGVNPDTITWGNIIESGRTDLFDAPNIVLAPSFVIFLTVLALNFLGDVLQAKFVVREGAL
ncbi:MAG: ABC transporter permease [Acidimicrobiia bacterium]